MRSYYIRTATFGTGAPHIIDEEAMYQAERKMNYLNPGSRLSGCQKGKIWNIKSYTQAASAAITHTVAMICLNGCCCSKMRSSQISEKYIKVVDLFRLLKNI